MARKPLHFECSASTNSATRASDTQQRLTTFRSKATSHAALENVPPCAAGKLRMLDRVCLRGGAASKYGLRCRESTGPTARRTSRLLELVELVLDAMALREMCQERREDRSSRIRLPLDRERIRARELIASPPDRCVGWDGKFREGRERRRRILAVLEERLCRGNLDLQVVRKSTRKLGEFLRCARRVFLIAIEEGSIVERGDDGVIHVCGITGTLAHAPGERIDHHTAEARHVVHLVRAHRERRARDPLGQLVRLRA